MRDKTPKTPKLSHHKSLIERLHFNSIQNAITIIFSTVSVVSMLIFAIILWANFFRQGGEKLTASTQEMIGQVGQNLESILGGVRQVSDAAYYDAIQVDSFSADRLNDEFSLLSEANKEEILSMALYDSNGALLVASPVSNQKKGAKVSEQGWFQEAVQHIENIHISLPHVQNLFDDNSKRYKWVISVSRMVEMNDGDVSRRGVLLVDLDYDAVAAVMEQLNDTQNGQYYYLCDSDGNIIFHPEMQFVQRGLLKENSRANAEKDDGIYEETLGGVQRTIIIQTISYTGWKLIGVIPDSARQNSMSAMSFSIVAVLVIAVMIILALNRFISSRISKPLRRLNTSVKDYEAGRKPDIYCGGTEEIQHLGRSIQKSYEQIEELIQQIIHEQNERRKSEIDALQGQIHPHFLYNTLDSITWMVEGGKEEEAVSMISDLGRLLRISLSKGKTIITIREEMQHAKSYMSIQKVRYKDQFISEFSVDPELNAYSTVKLIIQPLLENAIYYGVGGMDPDDGGRITVTGKLENGEVVLQVADNGAGMPEDVRRDLLDESKQVHKHGNGVGLVNVNRRIQLIFGKKYGLSIQSEPDRGTIVTVRFPAVLFTEENRDRLERGDWSGISPEEKL